MNQERQLYDRNVQAVQAILIDMSFMYLSKEFQQQVIAFLEIGDNNGRLVTWVAKKIVRIYQEFMGDFSQYFTMKRNCGIASEIKQYVWKVFKKYEEDLKKARRAPAYNNENNRQFMREPDFFETTPNNRNMNMVNMFLNVPELKSSQDIQNFQRKMYDVFKKAMPSVTNSLNEFRKSMQPRFMYNQMNVPKNIEGYEYSSTSQFPFAFNQMMPNYPGNGFKNMDLTGQMNTFMNMPPFQQYNKMYEGNLMRNNTFSEHFYPESLRHSQRQSCSESMISQGNPYQHQFRYPGSERNLRSEMMGSSGLGMPFGSYQRFKQRQNEEFRGYREKQDRRGFSENFREEQSLIKVSQPRKLVKKDDQVSIFDEKSGIAPQQNDFSPPERVEIECKCTCSEKQQQKCLFCEAKNFDPAHQIIQCLKLTIIPTNSYHPTQQILKLTISKQIISQIQKNKDYDIELRCFELDSTKKVIIDDIKWPIGYELEIDGEIYAKFEENLKNKKRSILNKKILVSQQLELASHTTPIQIILRKIDADSKEDFEEMKYFQPINFLLGIFLIQKHSVQSMRKIFTDKHLQKKNMDEMIKEYGGEAQQIIVSPYDPITEEIIVEPVRGDECQHFQCFDFKAYLQYTMLNDYAKWRCPKCQKRINKFIKDEQLQQILLDIRKMISLPQSIKFDRQGNHQLMYSASQSPKNESNKLKTTETTETANNQEKAK